MAAPYTETTIVNYNSNPPSDDGAQTAANRVQWSTEKQKLADPLKVAIESIDDNITTAFGKIVGGAGITSTAISYQVVAGDQGKLVVTSAASVTITTPDAATVGSPFVFGVLNPTAGNITLDGSGTQTINGALTLTMAPGDGYLIYTDGSNWFAIGRKTGILPRGYIDGCTIANGTDATNDIDVAAGVCRDSTNAVDITVTAMAGKQLDANWAAGASAGMRNSAVGIANGTYHIYAIAKADGTQDIYAHTSTTVATVITALQAETGGSAYLYARRIASILRESAAIVGFNQVGDSFRRIASVADITADNAGTSAVTRLLSVPLGIVVLADLSVSVLEGGAAGIVVKLSALNETDVAAGTNNFTVISALSAGIRTSAEAKIFTDTAAQIRSRSTTTASGDIMIILTNGWSDRRGKS